MGDVINLNRYRKLRERAREDQRAVSQRAKFGRTKADVQAEAKARERALRDLDGKKFDEPA